MPGNVAAVDVGTPARVMPDSLSRAFTETREYIGQTNSASDGRSTRAALTTNSRKYFEREIGLGDADSATMAAFFAANRHRAFYFYFWREGAFDATGTSSAGRYAVRFEPSLDRARGIDRQVFRYRIAEAL